ncbi:MAG TPA: hypothetical protein VNE16_13975 [Vicinamibacterales bacterium]|nr:hypothetical protein [Vicinamibacterales bacterium]
MSLKHRHAHTPAAGGGARRPQPPATTHARLSAIVQAALDRAQVAYELAGLEAPRDPWGIWTLTFLDRAAPPWARTFQLPLPWDAGDDAVAADLARQLVAHARAATWAGGA